MGSDYRPSMDLSAATFIQSGAHLDCESAITEWVHCPRKMEKADRSQSKATNSDQEMRPNSTCEHIEGPREDLEKCNKCSRHPDVVEIELDDKHVEHQCEWNESELWRRKHNLNVPKYVAILIRMDICLTPS